MLDAPPGLGSQSGLGLQSGGSPAPISRRSSTGLLPAPSPEVLLDSPPGLTPLLDAPPGLDPPGAGDAATRRESTARRDSLAALMGDMWDDEPAPLLSNAISGG